jgi:hypothetical protein
MCNSRISALTLVVTACGLCLLLSSCGGDSDTTSTVDALTKSEFIRQADEICSETEKRQLFLVDEFQQKRRAEGETQPPSSQDETEIVKEAGLPPLERQIEELSELPPPKTDSEQLAKYLQALEVAVKSAEKNPRSLLGRESDPFAKATSLASDFGFKVCSGA